MYWIVRRTYSWNVRTRKTYLLTRRMCSHDVRTRTARTYVLVWYCWNRTCADVTMPQCSIHEVAFPALVTILTRQVVSTVLHKHTHIQAGSYIITYIEPYRLYTMQAGPYLHRQTWDLKLSLVCTFFSQFSLSLANRKRMTSYDVLALVPNALQLHL